MSIASSNSDRSSLVTWGTALAASSILLVGGGAIIWANRGPAPLPDPSLQIPSTTVTAHVGPRELPLPPEVDGVPLHAIAYAVENGTPVIKIKVVADGDELIVDARTGRLLETRPSRPTAPPPMGKFAAPFAPMT